MNHYKDGLIVGFHEKSVIEGFGKRAGTLKFSDAWQVGRWEKDKFDLIFCHFLVQPGTPVINDIMLNLRWGGTAAFIIPSTVSVRSIRKSIFDQLNSQGAETQPILDIYEIIPSIQDIRLAVCLKNQACAAASLALYQPSLKKAKLIKYITFLLYRAGLSSLLRPNRLVLYQKGNVEKMQGFPSLAKKVFGKQIELALFTGTPGYLRKTTIQIMDAYGSILGYCKIGNTPQSKAILKNEADMLRIVKALSIKNGYTPALIFSGNFNTNDYYLIQSTSKAPLTTGPLIPDHRHVHFLTQLMEKSKCKSVFQESLCCQIVTNRLSSVRGYAGEESYHELATSFAWATQILTRSNVILCFTHRDFTPWNTFISNGELFVFDWEFAQPAWVPLTDAFHFILQKGILVDRALPDVLWTRLMSESSKEAKFLKQCASAIDPSEETFFALLVFYLCDMITMYLFHYMQESLIPTSGEMLINTWKRLLMIVGKRKGLLSF